MSRKVGRIKTDLEYPHFQVVGTYVGRSFNAVRFSGGALAS